MQYVANVKIPSDYGVNQTTTLLALAQIANRLKLSHQFDDRGYTQESVYGVERSDKGKLIQVFHYVHPRGPDNKEVLAAFAMDFDIAHGEVPRLLGPVKDPALVERIFREVLVKGLWGDEKNFLRPVYPEPQCYILEPDPQGGVPTRKIQFDWLNWYVANDYPNNPPEAAFKKILETEFAEPDRASKEAKFDTFRDGSCVLVEIYHVTRERV
jgi:hypothetical protein